MPSWRVLHGDCVEVMRDLPAGSVDSVVTSPPYAMQRASTYGGVPESEYPGWSVAWMREVRRLLKPDGSVIINIRPHIRNGQISDYTLRTRLALRDDGWNEVDELIWVKPQSLPTGSPRKPRRSWESLHWFSLHGRPFSDAKRNGVKSDQVGCPGYGNDNRQLAVKYGWAHHVVGGGRRPGPGIARCPDFLSLGLTRSTALDGPFNKHPARYPVELAAWALRLVTPVGGTVLDPFCGVSSTGVAAIQNDADYIGIDCVGEYVELGRARLAAHEAAAMAGVG